MLQLQIAQEQEDSQQHRVGLVTARLARHWTQQELADQIGTTYVNVSRWERGVTCPGPYARARLVEIFAKTEEDLDLSDALPTRSLEERAGLENGAPYATGKRPTIDPAVPLPQPWRLYGRDQLLLELKAQLRRKGRDTAYALDGLPGIGKTALATELAYDPEVRALFPDGVLWVRLGPEPHPIRALSRWGALLGVSQARRPGLAGLEAWATALRWTIGQRAMLLVIDDAWSLPDALAFKVGGPNCASLLTTRSPAVSTLFADTHVTQVGELGEQESLALLSGLAREVVCWKREEVRQLAQAVGGLPQALVLIGRYLHLMGMNHQTRRLRAALDRLTQIDERLCLSEPQAPLEYHASLSASTPLSLAAIIDASVGRLPQAAQKALSALAALGARPHSFTEEAAISTANCPVETLDDLYDAGLLQCVGQGRYSLHPTIRDFGEYRQSQC